MTVIKLRLGAEPFTLPADVDSVVVAAHGPLMQHLPVLPSAFTPGTIRFRTYVRLHTPSYREDRGQPRFVREAAKLAWEEESKRLIALAGMVEKYPMGDCDAGTPAFAHPDEICGEFTLEETDRVIRVVRENAALSVIRWIDFYGHEEDISVEEARLRVRFYENELAAKLVELMKTPRRTHFKTMNVAAALGAFPGLSIHSAAARAEAFNAAREVAHSMTDQGWLIQHPTMQGYYRSANSAERKALKPWSGLHA